MVPLGSAADGVRNGANWKEIGISLVGDAAFFATIGTSTLATVGAKGMVAARVLRRWRRRLELGIAGVRTADGIGAINEGDNAKAAGYFGEAFLRLFGTSAAVLQEIKTARNAAKALPPPVEPTPASLADDVPAAPVERFANNPKNRQLELFPDEGPGRIPAEPSPQAGPGVAAASNAEKVIDPHLDANILIAYGSKAPKSRCCSCLRRG